MTGLEHCAVVFEPADPPRAGRLSCWEPEAVGTPGALTVVAAPGTSARMVAAARLPIADALPALLRVRAITPTSAAHPAAAFWAAAVGEALHLVARGRILPGLTARDVDAWRVGPLDPGDVDRLREVAAAMPPEARAVPLPGSDPPRLPDAEQLLRAFLDAVADTVARPPAALRAAGGAALATAEQQRFPELRGWAHDVSAGLDAAGRERGVRVSLRVQPTGDPGQAPLRAVVQVHGVTDPTLVADAAELWSAAPDIWVAARFGPRARIDAMLAVRRAARVWQPLEPLLHAAVPDEITLADEEVAELLAHGATRLAEAGVAVHWPRELTPELSARAATRSTRTAPADLASFFADGELLRFDWQLAQRGEPLTEAEMDELAEATRPVVRLRDQWVLVDPDLAAKARRRRVEPISATGALGAALAGSVLIGGQQVEVAASGWLDALRQRIADPDAEDPGTGDAVAQPPALVASLRDHLLRGLRWLVRMTSLGLGGCLADDMGLGKTITLIALHLHRQADPTSAGPTLVVCPASLLGNWEREIERFTPGTPVRRFHGAGRRVDGIDEGFVLTTYGTLRLDADRLAARRWALLVADEAQHVKNPRSSTARALRTVPAGARVALTGTPVENNLSELWAILDWTTPGLLGTLGSFRARWGEAAEQDPVAAARLSRLVRPFLLRRRKSDPGIAPELPAKTETDQPVALTREQAGLYEAVVRETMQQIADSSGPRRRGLVLALLTALKQICNHPAQYLKETGPQLAGRSGKLELLDELLDTILAADGAVLVFTQYVAMARLLQRHLETRGVPAQLLHGGTPVHRREQLVDRFGDGTGGRVFLLSLKAAGTGLNLTRADHVIHYDRWWNPAVEEQATDRAYRIGQTRPVQVHRLITEGTVEDRIAALLASKRELADAVLGAGETALTELSDAELADLVALRGPR